MSFDVDIRLRLGDANIACAFVVDGGLTALFGPSGIGKTSVLNMIAGLRAPDSGHIIVDERQLFDSATRINVAAQDRQAGYIFQDARLFPHMKVIDNLLYGWRIAEDGQHWMTVEEATAFLDIGHLLERWPRNLSGGEAQRVAIGRALLSGPRFLLMDEPLASLDRMRRDEIMVVIERIRDDLRLPILYVSHDREEVDRLATKTLLLGG